jgi:phospholipid/cholesterol/gamma-HCH transport system substrate-binding protein
VKSFRDRNPYAVGVISVLLLGLVTGGAFAVGFAGLLKDTYEVRAVFADAAGLRSGNDVRLAGVKVGAVSGIDVDREHGTVVVTLKIDQGVDLLDGTTAEIALNTLLGAKVVQLGNGGEGDLLLDGYCDEREDDADALDPDGAPTAGESGQAACHEGDPTIRYANAGERVPFDVFELARIATEGVQELDTSAVNALVEDLADVSEGRRDDLTRLITSVDDVSRAITSRDAELAQLLQRADAITATLAEKDDTLVALIDQSREILALLDERRELLATTLGEGSEAVTALAQVISDNRVALDNLLTNLHPTIAVVDSQMDDLNRALAWAGPGFYGQALAGEQGPWLNIFVRSLGPVEANILCGILGVPDTQVCTG